jgi:hypothetical protein
MTTDIKEYSIEEIDEIIEKYEHEIYILQGCISGLKMIKFQKEMRKIK